jgi:hypothetical protein
MAEGATSFTVGQAAGTGTYTVGSQGQTLSDSSYYWRVKTIDDEAAESGFATANSGSIAFKVDATNPTAPGNLTENSKDSSSITLNFGSQTTETNFDTYKIFYKAGASGVAETDTEHSDADLAFINYNGTSTTTISGLSASTQYVINIWAYDLAGNKASATEMTVTTSAPCGSITLDNSDSSACTGASITSCTISNFNLGYASGNNRLVLVGVTTEGQSEVTDVTFNGTSGTEVNPELDFDSMATISLWYFLDTDLPSSSGNYDISATTSAVTDISIMVISVIGAAQQVPEDTGTGSCTSCGAISAPVTTTTDGAWIFDAVHCGDNNYAGEELTPTGTGQTEPSGIELSNSTSSASMSYKELAAAGNFTMAWDHTDASTLRMGDYAVVFAPASCGGGNQTPNDPTINDHNDGSTTSDNTPTLGFTQSDPDASEQVKYRIQIDNTDNTFNSLVVDYTSALMAEGATSFTVGQAAGSGTYTVGSEGQTLADGDYFWRVMTTDDESAASGWTQATTGSNVAFTVDTSGTALYRSVGTTATALASGTGNALTISGSTATFGSGLSDNIGVGDVIEYDSDGNSSIDALAFIHGRTDSQTYTVKDKDGNTPIAVTGDNDWKIYRAYNSLANWESQTQNASITYPTPSDVNPSTDLVTANTVMMVACYGDGVDSSAVTINGWTTDSDRYIKIYTPTATSEVGTTKRHSGAWDNNKYRIEASGRVIDVWEENIRIEGLQIKQTAVSSAGDSGILYNGSGVTDLRISHNIIQGVTHASIWHCGIEIYSGAAGSEARIWNNIIYDFQDSVYGQSIYFTDGDFTAYVYNNTAYNNGNAYYSDGGDTVIAKNNIAFNNGDDYNGMDSSSDNNLGEDAAFAGDANYVQTTQSATEMFVDPSGDNFHILSTSDAYNAGSNLSSDPNLDFSDDIDRGTRSGTWDIGADEYGASSATALYRSVGTTATALENGTGNALTISGSTATFGSGLSDNIGVGDVIEYDSDGNSSIDALAFIHGRTDSQTYTVKDKDGNTPTAVSGDNDWAIYRVYTSLANWESQTENTNITEPVENDVNPSADLITANTVMMVACYGDGADTTSFAIDASWVTGPNNFIKIYTPVASSEVGISQRHAGKWDNAKYRLEPPTNSGIYINTNYARIEGLQITVDRNSGANDGIATSIGSAGEIQISHCIFKGVLSGTATNLAAISSWNDSANLVVKVWNNILYDFINSSNNIITIYNNTAKTYAYNNTLQNVWIGLAHYGGTFVAKNNIVQDANDGYVGTFTSSDYNISNLASDAPSPSYRSGLATTLTFADKAADDFHLDAGDTDALDVGTDLSSDPNLAFSDDIDGGIRSGTWDIGVDEYVATIKSVYYSVGTSTADLKNDSPTITISGGTATLSVAQTGNIGVGDVITYNTSSKAYISGVNSQTSFEVITATGGTPGNVSGQTVNSIKRVFNSIDTAVSSASGASYLNTANLVTGNFKLFLVCYNDGPFAEAITINTYTTDATYFMTLTVAGSSQVANGTSQRHDGKAGSGAVVQPPAAAGYGISVEDTYTVVEWLEVDGSNVTALSSDGVQVEVSGGENATLQNLIIHDWDETNDGGIYASLDNLTIRNAIVYNNTCSMQLEGDFGTIQNVTIWGGGCGLLIMGNNGYTVENVVSMGSSGNDFSDSFGGLVTFNNNISSDTTAGDYGGSGNLVNRTATDDPTPAAGDWVVFADLTTGSEDFHLQNVAENDALNAGADLSGTFTDDIDGETRPTGANTWDIGADEIDQSCNDSFAYRRLITIDAGQVEAPGVGGSLSNFPVLVSLAGPWLRTTAADPTNGRIEHYQGWDIVFRDSDGVTQLDHEIEYYNGSGTSGDITLADGWYTGTGAYTVPAGTDRLLVFVTGFEHIGSDFPITNVTFGGVSMTRAIGDVMDTSPAAVDRCEIWYLKDANIPSGSNSFVVTYSGGTPSDIMHAYGLYSNVNQINPIVHTMSNPTTTNDPVEATVNVEEGGMGVAGVVGGIQSSYVWGNSWSERTDQQGTGTVTMSTSDHAAAADGTDTASADLGGPLNLQVLVIASLRPASAGNLVAWVKIPSLSESSNTDFYMYYGNACITNNTENPEGVWDTANGWRGVWHLTETVTDEGTAAGAHFESTSNPNDGDQSGNDDTVGQIAYGQQFDGTDDYISCGNDSSLDITGNVTVEAWV